MFLIEKRITRTKSGSSMNYLPKDGLYFYTSPQVQHVLYLKNSMEQVC